ncbi:hypothetical protein HDV00_002270 [Rhizophlyctis rosea]|nr:hypothetical protein HDV00_002270 [Rhizophlyctis rosea]
MPGLRDVTGEFQNRRPPLEPYHLIIVVRPNLRLNPLPSRPTETEVYSHLNSLLPFSRHLLYEGETIRVWVHPHEPQHRVFEVRFRCDQRQYDQITASLLHTHLSRYSKVRNPLTGRLEWTCTPTWEVIEFEEINPHTKYYRDTRADLVPHVLPPLPSVPATPHNTPTREQIKNIPKENVRPFAFE